MQEKHIDKGRSVPRKNWLSKVFKGSWLVKWVLLAFTFFISLTFFLHFREVQMELLEIGTEAPYYVISQADFSFQDEEATQALKQEAIRDIGAIYKIEETELRSYRRNFENSLIEHQQWRKELPRTSFDKVYGLLDQIEDLLQQVRFIDERTLNKMDAAQLNTHDFFLLKFPVITDEHRVLPFSLWKEVQQVLQENKEHHPEAVEYLVAAFSRHEWSLQPDFVLQNSIQQEIKQGISDRFTHIEAGIQIIKKGEIVTSRHITMLQGMKAALDKARNLWTPLTLVASALIAASLTIMALFFLHFSYRELFRSFKKVVLLVVITLMSLFFAKVVEYILLSQESNWIEVVRFPLLLPFGALLISILISTEIAMSTSFFLLIVFSVGLAVDYIPFLVMNFFAAVMTIFFAKKLHRRKEVFSVCGKLLLSLIPLIIAFNLLEHQTLDFNFLTDLVSCVAFLGVTALIVVSLLPLLESVFQVMTDMTLMEYMDPDHELLRRLSLEAPGTYQHSLVVGHIAEVAARAVGGNGLFCRVATLYHDIGKLFNPHYFTENQLGGFNIHQLLTPIESTQVIISHVSEGEALARKHHLPQSFIDVIREHHGTTMVYYFYCKQVEHRGGDVTQVNEKQFRYPGPKPRSKESAIIMIADTVEAASRSINEMTEAAVLDMVDKLVLKKAEDGQFDECQLTFEELGRVKKAIVKALVITCHLRIKYPER